VTDAALVDIPVGRMTFRARVAGPDDGRLVLLLHGFPQSSYEWRSQLAALAGAGYRAVAPDQRGYSPGARPEGVEHYATAHLVADVIAIADWLGAHQVDLVGHDWGGAVAWLLAARYPERLRSLTVVSTPHPAALYSAIADGKGDQQQRSQYMEVFRQEGTAEDLLLANDAFGLRQLYEASGLPADAGDEYVRLLAEPGAMTAALNWYRAMSPAEASGLPLVTTPTLYVWSDADIALGREAAEATAQYVEGPYRFEVLHDVSHWVPEAAPDQLNALLLEHLEATA
jgi:pimeloyl-ACP methyl ester carboxylesterase